MVVRKPKNCLSVYNTFYCTVVGTVDFWTYCTDLCARTAKVVSMRQSQWHITFSMYVRTHILVPRASRKAESALSVSVRPRINYYRYVVLEAFSTCWRMTYTPNYVLSEGVRRLGTDNNARSKSLEQAHHRCWCCYCLQSFCLYAKSLTQILPSTNSLKLSF
jgi:hypothetical protein